MIDPSTHTLPVNTMPYPSKAILFLVVVMFFGITGFLVWAHFAQFNITAKGIGSVIPASKTQQIQNLEGGILTDVLVREGQEVQANQAVARIDGTLAGASFNEDQAVYFGLLASIARLQAQVDGTDMSAPLELADDQFGINLIAENRTRLGLDREKFEQRIAAFNQQIAAKEASVTEAGRRLRHIRRQRDLAVQEAKLIREQVQRGLVSSKDLLSIERQIAELETRISEASGIITTSRIEVEETRFRIEEERSAFRGEASRLLAEDRIRAEALREKLVGSADRVSRRDVLSPVRGIVASLNYTTAGAVIKPGEAIMEIVPVDDDLVIEARIQPKDIAFIREGQTATVSITAYDPSIFGRMEGLVDRVGADTQLTEDQQSYYPVQIRVTGRILEFVESELPILPGMVAEVSIITGERTLLDYVLKPITKLRQEALQER